MFATLNFRVLYPLENLVGLCKEEIKHNVYRSHKKCICLSKTVFYTVYETFFSKVNIEFGRQKC